MMTLCCFPVAGLFMIPASAPRAQTAWARAGVPALLVQSVESTPNPSAFLLRLDALPEGVVSNGLRGETFQRDGRCPPGIKGALEVEGVASLFAVGALLTVSKVPSASWEAVLPPVIEAFGGASASLEASGLPSFGASNAPPATAGAVAIRLQLSQKLPIQVEASGWSGACPPVPLRHTQRTPAAGLALGQPEAQLQRARE